MNEANNTVTEVTTNNEERKPHTHKVVYSAWLAKKLLRMGNRIVDIRPNKENTDRTAFVFKKTKKLDEDWETAVVRDSVREDTASCGNSSHAE